MKGSDLLVSALENEGVERVFGVPGEENLDLVESLRRSRIKLVVTRHEQPAAFMAATHGRLTGQPGVCFATLGPGALNLTTGAACALLGAMPMIMITGQKGILSRKQGRFQVVDVVATMAPLTKMARQIVSPSTIPTILREAFRLAQQERPGPVHLELPEDIAAEQTSEIPPIKPHPIEIPLASAQHWIAQPILYETLSAPSSCWERPPVVRAFRISCRILFAACEFHFSTRRWVRAQSQAAFAPAKAAQRSLAESMARKLWPEGIHVALIVIDGVVDLPSTRAAMPDKPDDAFVDPAGVAEIAYQLCRQNRRAWSFEVEARPYAEKW